jgi:hypothetical protein
MLTDSTGDRETIAMLDRPCPPAPPPARAPARAPSRRPWLQLIAAVTELAGSDVELIRHTERGWASITFSGTRHAMVLAFTGTQAGEQFIAALPDHEFTIPRQLVAEATVVSVDQTVLAEPKLVIEIELLLLEDA